VKYAWIERHRNAYPVGLMCESLGVSKSGWYAARRRAPSQRAVENARLVTRMQSLQRRHRGRYGRRRMRRALRGEVGVINEKRVGRLMRQHGLQSRLRRRFLRGVRGFRDPERTQAFLSSYGPIRQHFAL
jgi:putative transposase